MPLEKKIYPPKRTTVLVRASGYSFDDSQSLQALCQNRAKIANHIAKQPISLWAPTIVRYEPSVFGSNPKLNLDKTLYTNACADDWRAAKKWRLNTKHRSVTSFALCYWDGKQQVSPFPIVITTGCGVNFMGSSKEEKEKYFKSGTLLTANLIGIYKQLFKQWLSAQDEAGFNVVMLPFIGGGVYLKELGDYDKNLAVRSIQEGLKQAINASQFNHILEIIFALPDETSGKRSDAYKAAVDIFKKGYDGNVPTLTVANVDIFSAAKELSDKRLKVGIINPGSDRTIGGHYKKVWKRTDISASPMEELLSLVTDFVYRQARDFNTNQWTYQPYSPAVSPVAAASSSSSSQAVGIQEFGIRQHAASGDRLNKRLPTLDMLGNLNGISQVLGARACFLIKGDRTYDPNTARLAKDIANVKLDENNMTLKFTNKQYAHRLEGVLKDNGISDVDINDNPEPTKYGSYACELGFPVKYVTFFMTKICQMSQENVAELCEHLGLDVSITETPRHRKGP